MGWLPTAWTIDVSQWRCENSGRVLTEGRLTGAPRGEPPAGAVGTRVGPLAATDQFGLTYRVPAAVITYATGGRVEARTDGPFSPDPHAGTPAPA